MCVCLPRSRDCLGHVTLCVSVCLGLTADRSNGDKCVILVNGNSADTIIGLTGAVRPITFSNSSCNIRSWLQRVQTIGACRLFVEQPNAHWAI